MSDSSKPVKPRSIAAFLFMPQFSLSTQHFAFVIPVFISTIAMMFEQAGLLPKGHPATRYGMEGVKKYKFRELLGEAWYTLRATRATPYQWSMFVAVVLMTSLIILSALMTVLSVAGVFMGTAQAQIFDSKNGDTGFSSVPQASGNPVFDTSVPPLNNALDGTGDGHGEWGIMILDKLLRQGAAEKGGLLQNAFGSLMQIYNTAILVIAGIMILWLIMFIVTDTAKTGQIGGQRHNMVWGPIRIVFALGLLIPLGSSGFSSGQYMVMKLAEWGNNLGTRGWVAYVDSIVNSAPGSQPLVAAYGAGNSTSIVSQYVQLMICRVAYNGYMYQALSNPAFEFNLGPLAPPATDADGDMQKLIKKTGWVRRYPVPNPPEGSIQFSFTNNVSKSLCGTITLPKPPKTWDEKASGLSFLSSLGIPLESIIGPKDPIREAVLDYKKQLAIAYIGLFTKCGEGKNNSDVGDCFKDPGAKPDYTKEIGTPLWPDLKAMACGFTRNFVHQGGEGDKTDPLGGAMYGGLAGASGGAIDSTGSDSYWDEGGQAPENMGCGKPYPDYCGAGAAEGAIPLGTPPNASCMRRMVKTVSDAVNGANDAAYKAAIDNNFTPEKFLTDVRSRGWVGMGIWYHRIERANSGFGSARNLDASLQKGDYGQADTYVMTKVSEVLNAYRKWWVTTASEQVCVKKQEYGSSPATDCLESNTSAPDLAGILDAAQDSGDTSALASDIFNAASGTVFSMFFNDMNDPKDKEKGTYPLAVLSKVGGDLMGAAVTIYSTIAIMEIIGAFVGGALQSGGMAASSAFFGLGAMVGTVPAALGGGLLAAVNAFINGPLTALITTVAGVMFAGSLVLKFYIPMLPFVKVAFSVVTWMVSVFEAVVMVPIAALAHINTEGEGLTGGAKAVWVLWLNILLRPILTVIGFVGALLLFNTFVVWIHEAFASLQDLGQIKEGGTDIFDKLAYSIIYVFIVYTVANSCFKLLDIIPNALMKWIGAGSADNSFDSDASGIVSGSFGRFGSIISSGPRRGGFGGGGGGAAKAARADYEKDKGVTLKRWGGATPNPPPSGGGGTP